MRNKCLLFKLPSLWFLVIYQPDMTKTLEDYQHLEHVVDIQKIFVRWMDEWMNTWKVLKCLLIDWLGLDRWLTSMCVCVCVVQLCTTLCNPVNYSPPGSSVNGILQARIMEWVAIPFSRGSSWLRDRPPVSCIAGRFFTVWATREAPD